jgi:dTDP-4-amino-4,6-dideoxygalactose transaminase
MEALRAIADEHNLYLIEDAAHAVETRYHDKPVGYYSDFTCFSFYATKNITSGEGGALLVRDPDLYRRAQVLSLHGMSRDAWKRYEGGASPYYDVAEPGFKYNMFDLQAALLIPQLAKVEKFLESRTALVAAYEARLKNHPLLTILQARDNSRPAHHLMPVLIDFTKLQITREELNQLLHQWNIGVSLHFIPVHLMSYYRNKYGCKEGDLPVTESAFDQLVSLPLCPSMTEQDVDYVCEVLIKILGENS